jgi:hypothetical protein
MIHTGKRRSAPAVLLLGLIALVLVVAGCGGGTSASPSASPSGAAGSTAQRVLALKAYVTQLKPIYNEVATSVGSLDGAVSRLSKRPDRTWATTAVKLQTSAAGLGTAATQLAAITPPPALQSAQAGLVTALQQAQKVLATSGAYLAKAAYLPSFPDIRTQIKSQVTDALKAAWTNVLNTVNSGALPTPAATP